MDKEEKMKESIKMELKGMNEFLKELKSKA